MSYRVDRLRLLALLMLLVMLIAACGRAETDAGPSVDAPPPQQAPAENEPESTEAAPAEAAPATTEITATATVTVGETMTDSASTAADALVPAPTVATEAAVEPAAPVETSADRATTVTLVDDYHVLGNPDAPITFIDYSDFLCVTCRNHVLNVEPEIVANYVATGQVKVAFHHMLDFGEPSLLASRTAECAGAQSPLAFWQMHDLLFARQGELWQASEELMVQLAGELGLDGTALSTCLADNAIAEKVQRMDQARRDAGIRLRPSFEINGEIYQGALPYTALTQVLDAAAPQ